MAITLYGDLRSRAHRVAWALKELGLEYRHVPTHFLDGSTQAPPFKRINPNGRVPALVDGELALFESLAINLYLARRYGAGRLGPADIEEDALCTQWSLWVANEIEGPLLFASANQVLFPPEGRDAAEVALAMEKLARPFGVLDDVLQRRHWLVGSRFTVADLNVASVMSLIRIAKLDVRAWPALDGWLTRGLERPAAADWKPITFTIPRPPTMQGLLKMFI
jgi:glutathione S-transferase